VSAGKADSLVVLAAYAGERLVGAGFAQMLAGRAAVITRPQTLDSVGGEVAAVEDALLAAALRELHTGGMHLAQCLLPFGDAIAAAAIRRSGFTHSADLLYLVASSESFPEAPLNQPFELESWNPADEPRLIRILNETYAGTLDCPEIDGLRDTADVLRGYLATGEYRPELWHIVRHNGCDVGCLLLTLHPAGPHCELVYVGLVPSVRGRGWGIELTRHAQWLSRQVDAERLVLAVDASNEPAVRIYVAAGFAAWDRRQLWLKPLKTPK
jgi:ribosomal protein S18 acetylase RimI-like enzyme